VILFGILAILSKGTVGIIISLRSSATGDQLEKEA
jgi:hypothetical protein